MPLPILQPHGDPTISDLLRYYARAELHWTRHVAEETELDTGVAFTNPELPRVFEANRMFNVALPDGITPQQAFDEAERHFAAAGTRCWFWTINPSADSPRTRPISEFLESRAYIRRANDVMLLKGFPTEPLKEVGDLTIIPARASFRHARAIADELAADWKTPEVADAFMLHLDDPHTDSLLALRGGVAAAFLAVLAAGETGIVAHLHVSAPFRAQGIGRTMMSRALEICARSLFKHFFVEVEPQNAAAIHLYQRCGFRKIGEVITYRLPA